MNDEPRFTWTGNSSNIDFYSGTTGLGAYWGYVEVLVRDFKIVHKPDGTRTLAKVTPPTYDLTIRKRIGPGGFQEYERLTYRPTRKPAGGHLPDRTVARLVRQHVRAEDEKFLARMRRRGGGQ